MGPDHLSCIETGEEPTSLEEGLPNAQLFVVHIADGHFEDIIHFLTIGTVLEGYSFQKKKELVVCTTDFSFIVGHLYKMGNDEILRRYCCGHNLFGVFLLFPPLFGMFLLFPLGNNTFLECFCYSLKGTTHFWKFFVVP